MADIEWRRHVTCVDLSLPLCRLASCRAELPPRRSAYCSDRHARAFERDHLWFVARRVARRRAGYVCERCGLEPRAVRRDSEARLAFARHELRLEVDHVTPLAGAYRLVSCANHQTNLRVLCHRCHVLVTAVARGSMGSKPGVEGQPLQHGEETGLTQIRARPTA